MSSVEQQLFAMQEKMFVGEVAPSPLHSLSTRPHYEWTPSEAQVNIMHMDVFIHTSKPLATPDRKVIIEAYRPVAQQLKYHSPATVPSAEQDMNNGQKIEDNYFKHLQHQTLAILGPLDVLVHDMLTQDLLYPEKRYKWR
ncbi:hypothetical protein PS6_006066 [Mucor atramentarius]